MTRGYAEEKVLQLARDWGHDPNYYDNADNWVDKFWSNDSIFRAFFDNMDPQSILEIACGRGRHTWQMRDWSNKKTMMDLVEENVEFCRERFKAYPDIRVVKGNGLDLSFSQDSAFTAVFCYDAMVHFDHTIVYSYLSEIARVLKNDGKALLHHSNFGGNPGGDYKSNPNWRAFMPPGLFLDYCAKSGLRVEESTDISWGDTANCDTVSLLCKSS